MYPVVWLSVENADVWLTGVRGRLTVNRYLLPALTQEEGWYFPHLPPATSTPPPSCESTLVVNLTRDHQFGSLPQVVRDLVVARFLEDLMCVHPTPWLFRPGFFPQRRVGRPQVKAPQSPKMITLKCGCRCGCNKFPQIP